MELIGSNHGINKKIYKKEVEQIRSQFGGLEEIRSRLGMSRRKICQLLLVDPSAWTRWTKEGQDAPPHIYRALSWYLENSRPQVEKPNRSNSLPVFHAKNLESEVESLHRQLEELKKELLNRESAYRSTEKLSGLHEPRRKRRTRWFFLGQVLIFVLIYWLIMRKI